MTPREELQEALAKAYELLEQKGKEETAASAARAFYNELVNQLDTQALEEQVQQEIASRGEELNQAMEAEIDKLRKPLEVAQQRFDRGSAAAQGRRDSALEEFSQERRGHLLQVKTDHETRLAEAEMAVHEAKQRATNLENTFNRHCENFKAQRGPDLKTIIESLKE